MDESELVEKTHKNIKKYFRGKEVLIDSDMIRDFEKAVYLNVIDQLWKEYSLTMDHLRHIVK